MDTFYFPSQPVPFIRRALLGKPQLEIEQAERAFLNYLDLCLRLYEAQSAEEAQTPEV